MIHMKYPSQWTYESGALIRTFIFKNFVDAVAFVGTLVPLAEKAHHHPDIEIFSYKNVKVKLTTHDAGNSVTEKDIELSKMIDETFSR